MQVYPVYAGSAYLLLLYGLFINKIIKVRVSILCYLVGIVYFSLYTIQSSFPSWYASQHVYTISAFVHNISFTKDKKTRVLLSNITPLERVDIQAISKKKSCVVNKGGRILYTTARRCAVAYPIEGDVLPQYALYTIVGNKPAIRKGQYIKGVFQLEDIQDYNNGGFSLQQYYAIQGIYYRARLKHDLVVYGTVPWYSRYIEYVQNRFDAVINKIYPQKKTIIEEETIAIARALLLGSRYTMTTELEQKLITAGLLHSVVLSGLHVSSLLIFVIPIVWLLVRITPRIIYYVSTKRLAYSLLFVFAFGYACITDFPISYTRALFMLAFALLLSYSYARFTLLDLLLYTIFMLFLIAPHTLFTLSLQLSCGAILAIYLIYPLLHKCSTHIYTLQFPISLRHIFVACISLLGVNIAITLILAPYLLSTFGSFSHIIFLNIIWSPLLAFFILPTLLVAFLCSLFTFDIFFLWKIALCGIKVLLYILNGVAQYEWFTTIVQMRPHPCTIISFYLILFALISLCNQRVTKKQIYAYVTISIILLCIPIGLRIYTTMDSHIYLDIFDVGKGQALLIQHKGKRLLLDAGEKQRGFDMGERILSPLLTYNRPPHLNGLLLTHQDNDHIGGAQYLLKHFHIDNLYYNGDDIKQTRIAQSLRSQSPIPLHAVYEGDKIPITSELYLEILLPTRNTSYTTSNARSIVALLRYKKENVALLLGDIDIAGQAYIVERYGTQLRSPLLLLSHHGSIHNMYSPLYTLVQAQYAIASTSKEDSIFVPPLMRDILSSHNTTLYTTHSHGKIRYIYNQGISTNH